jgi:putative membrane protein
MANEANKTKVSKENRCDAKFAVCETDRGMLEAKLSDLAQLNGSSPAVKKFSREQQEDQERMNRELKSLAEKKNITVPDNLSECSQKALDKMSQKKGEKFDKAYLHCMKKGNKKQYCKYKKEAKKGNDAEMKSWAAAEEPKIKKDIDETKDACKQMKDEK